VHEIQDHQLVRVERDLRFASHSLQEPNKARISYLPVQGERNLPGIGVGEVRQVLTFPNAAFIYAICTLAGTLDEAAPGKRIRDTTVSGKLAIENVFWCDAFEKASRANDLDAATILADED
jgi:hypothetical protein